MTKLRPRLPRFFFTLATATAISALLPETALAYCTLPTAKYAFADAKQCVVDKEIPIYINIGARSIARTGLAIDDIERLVRTAIAAFNESGVRLPRLVYGGGVSHDTRYTMGGLDGAVAVALYKMTWATETMGLPLGITIQAPQCPAVAPDEQPDGVAGVLGIDDPGNIGFNTVTFKPFWDDNQVPCQRAPHPVPTCVSVPAEPDPTDTTCDEGDVPIPCTCTFGPPDGQHKCTMDEEMVFKWSGCLCTYRGYEAYNLGDGTAHPDEPQSCDALGPLDTKDFLGVLMHEIGHALGLNHAQIPQDQCDGLVSIGDTQGIMRSDRWGTLLSKARRPHADDLEGLKAFFDSLGVQWKRDYQLVFFESTDSGLTWGPSNPVTLPTTGVRTRPAVTSAVDDTGLQAIAFGDGNGDVFHIVRNSGGFQAISDAQAKVPGAFSHFPVAVAYGEGRLMIAWVHQESFKDRHSNIRWAIRDTDANEPFAWTFGDYWEQTGNIDAMVQKEIGLGFDPALGLFILSAIRSTDTESPDFFPNGNDGKPLFIAVDPITGEVDSQLTFFAAPVLRSIGKPVCHLTDMNEFVFSSHCAVPIVAAVPGGPEAQMLYLAFQAGAGFGIFGSSLQPLGVVDHGLVDLAVDFQDLSDVRFVGAWTSADPAPPEAPVQFEIFRTRASVQNEPPDQEPVGVEPIGGLDIDEAPGAPGAAVLPAWPAAIGSQWNDGQVTFSAWRVDPAQADEDPVDPTQGNPTEACDLTTSSGTSGTADTADTADTSETTGSNPSTEGEDSASGTGGPGDPPGCDCGAAGNSPPWGGLVFAPWLRRRARARRA